MKNLTAAIILLSTLSGFSQYWNPSSIPGKSIVTTISGNTGNYFGNVFNVKNYGAVGDGVANDHPAITNALNAATLAGGGVIYFPIGTYAMSASTINRMQDYTWRSENQFSFICIRTNNISFVGEDMYKTKIIVTSYTGAGSSTGEGADNTFNIIGAGTQIGQPTDTNTVLFPAQTNQLYWGPRNGRSNLRFENFTLDGGPTFTNNYSDMTQFFHTTNVVFRNIVMTRSCNEAFDVYGDNFIINGCIVDTIGGAAGGFGCMRSTISDCIFKNLGMGFLPINTNAAAWQEGCNIQSSFVQMVNCVFGGTNAALLHITEASTGVRVSHCSFNSTSPNWNVTNITILGSEVSMSDCSFKFTGYSDTLYPVMVASGNRFNLQNCKFLNDKVDLILNGTVPVVRGCQFEGGHANSQLWINSTTGANIIGNYFENGAGGLRVNSGAHGGYIGQNYFNSASCRFYGGTNWTITGNVGIGNTTFELAGSSGTGFHKIVGNTMDGYQGSGAGAWSLDIGAGLTATPSYVINNYIRYNYCQSPSQMYKDNVIGQWNSSQGPYCTNVDNRNFSWAITTP